MRIERVRRSAERCHGSREILALLGRDPVEPQRQLLCGVDRLADLAEGTSGHKLILERGSLQRFQASQRDPALVVFDRYAFDLSRFSNIAKNVPQTVRDR